MNYQNPYYNNYYNQQPMQQPVVYPLTFTNGVIGAKAFFMQQPNSIVYLLDSDTNNVLYEKKADHQGRCTLRAFQLKEIPVDQVGNQTQVEYATKSDIESIVNNSIANLLTTLKGAKNDE